MKKIVAILVLLITITSACGDKSGRSEIKAPEGMNVLDLTRFGKPFALFVPDTSKSPAVVTEQSSGALHVSVGKNFALSINEQPADLALKKEDLGADEVNKLKGMIVDEPNALFWESAITSPEYHFVINHKVGGSEYSIEDLNNNDEPLGKESVSRMFESGKAIQPIEHGKP